MRLTWFIIGAAVASGIWLLVLSDIGRSIFNALLQ